MVGDEALLVVTRPGEHRRVAARSLVWVPVRQGDGTVALLSLQSYRQNAFDEWHVQLLEDVGAHVSLALANASHFANAQTERRRLEALHTLDRRVAAAADERQVAEAFFAAARSFVDADGFLVAYLDSGERLGGWRAVGDEVEALPPRHVTDVAFLHRLAQEGAIALPRDEPDSGLYPWVAPEPARLKLFAPIFQESRVAGVLGAFRAAGRGPAAAMRATIGGLLQWQDVMEAEQRGALLEAAYDQSQRLLSLVEGQLITAQLETGRFTPTPESVPLRRVLDDTLAVLRHRFERRVRAIEVEIPEDGASVYCDPVHLQQVLLNLVGNAMEYTRADPAARSAAGRVARGVGPRRRRWRAAGVCRDTVLEDRSGGAAADARRSRTGPVPVPARRRALVGGPRVARGHGSGRHHVLLHRAPRGRRRLRGA